MLEVLMWFLYAIVLYISFFLIITLLDDGKIKPETSMREEFPSLSLIIPAYNEEDTIQMTVDSALEIDYPKEKFEIIVVNDGSTDSTPEKLEKYSSNSLVTILHKENGGKGSALNEGVTESESEVVACVDADSKLEEKSLKHLVSEMGEEYEGVASAMKVLNPTNLLQRLQWVEYMVGIFTRNIMGLLNAIHVTPGPLSIYRRDKLEEVGLFDEDSLVEDQEICFRLQRNHYKIANASLAEVYTVVPSNLKDFVSQRYRWYRGSLETAWENRDMIFNDDYGDFGMFAVPAKWGQTVLSIFVLFLTVYLFSVPMLQFLYEFSQIGLKVFSTEPLTFSSIATYLYWKIISVRYVSLIFIGSLFGISTLLAYMAAVHTDERLLKHGLIPVIAYLGFFVFINGILWLFVIIKMAVGSERTW